MQVVPNSEMTVGDTVEFELNGNTFQSKITNSSVDNNLIVWVDEFSIALDNVKNVKRIKCGPWHKFICDDTIPPKCEEVVLTTNAKGFVSVKGMVLK